MHSNATFLFNKVKLVGWDKIAFPSVVVSEVLRGRIDYALKANTGSELAKANRLLMQTYEMLQNFNVFTSFTDGFALRLVFDEASGREFDTLRRRYTKHKRRADMLIASMALSGKHIVVTRNVKHFRELLPPSQIENWVDIPPR